jgi:hypothetical protein
MPIAKVQMPDGRIAKFEVPDGTTPEQVKEFAAQMGQEKETGPMSWGEAGTKAVQNIPKSAGEFAGNIYQAVRHPMDTATALKDVFVGGVQNAIPEWMQAESAKGQREKASAVGQFFKDRYGGMENIKQTLANDPVGLLADASTVATGGGALLAKAPGLAGKIGNVTKTVGQAIDPITLAGKVVKPVANFAGNRVANVIGDLGTHTGAESIRQAARAGYAGGQHADDFQSALRGTSSIDDVVTDAKRAVGNLAKGRSNAYKASMAGISADKSILDFAPIDLAMNNAMSMGQYKGKSISTSTTKTLKQIKDVVDDWKNSDPAIYHTPEGLDALKKSIGDIRDSTEFRTPSRTVADNIYHAVKTQIVKQAPEYGKAMEGYSAASKQIKDLEKGLSLGEKATTDTALRKLQSVMRNNANTNYGKRVDMANTLKDAGAPTLMSKLAGQSMSSWAPRGLQNVAALGYGGAGYLLGGIPGAAATMAVQSPRLMGEAAYYAGKAAKPTSKAMQAISPYLTPAYQAGNIEELLRGLLEE